MASRLEWFGVTVPANTPVATPVTTSIAFTPSTVEALEFHIPPGPAGNVGFQLWNGGGQYWPLTPGQFMVLDDVHPKWPITDAPNNGAWSVVAYNTDIYPHLIQIGFSLVQNSLFTASTPSQIPVGV